jgi:uncharacterized protein YodC (DUF2158 family)
MTAKIGDVGTLRELDVKPGDVVEFGSEGIKYTVTEVVGGRYGFSWWDGKGSIDPIRYSMNDVRLISRAAHEPKTWSDLSPEEKGALLLAAHEKRDIEAWRSDERVWVTCGQYIISQFAPHRAYRIKPEPKRETVGVYINGDNKIGTIDTLDGEPVMGTFKEVNKWLATVS